MSEEEYISEEEDDVEEEEDEEIEEEEEEAPAAKGKGKGKGKAAAKTAKPEKRKKDPSKPKGALSAYMFFMKAKRPEVAAKNPGEGVTVIATKVAELWRATSDADKGPYEKQAAADKARYQKEMASYTPPAGDSKTGAKRAKKDPNAPKRAMSAYFFFLADKRPSITAANPGINVGDVAKKASEMWKALSDAQKKPYNDQAAAAKVTQAAAVAEYKKQ